MKKTEIRKVILEPFPEPPFEGAILAFNENVEGGIEWLTEEEDARHWEKWAKEQDKWMREVGLLPSDE